jgi:hypothetical protein
VVEAEFGLLEAEVEGVVGDAAELDQPSFGVAPQRLDAVDVAAAVGEFAEGMVDSEVLGEADVNQPVVPPPPSLWMTLCGSTWPRIALTRVFFSASGTIPVST